MKLCLFTLLFSLLFHINGIAQEDTVLLENAIEVKFELSGTQQPSFQKYLVLKVHLKNTTEDSLHLLSNSCYGLGRFFKCKNENIFINSGISCSFSTPEIQKLLPKESIEFEMYLYLRNGVPQKGIDIGLEIVKISKEKLNESEDSLYLYDEDKHIEKFVFWKTVEDYSFRLNIPLLKI
jgi:hypothetical protein